MEETKVLDIWKELAMEMRPKIRYWLPGAAMDESDLRLEVQKLYERGFGGIEAVVLASLPEDIARSEDGWGTKNWDKMMAILADETDRLGMSLDIAIGPGWPIASPAIKDADDVAALCELTWGAIEVEAGSHYSGSLPQRRTIREEGTARLVHVLAYQKMEEQILSQTSYMDLMPYVRDGQLDVTFPTGEGGKFVIFAFYQQPAVHKINSDQTYTIDHLSIEGAEACEKYWDEVFAKNDFSSMESFFCDSLEYNVALDWTPKLLEEFQNRRGYSLLPFLPFIGLPNLYPPCDIPGFQLDDPDISEAVNHDYLETLTQCYCENHLSVLERIAEKYGKTVRYQVAYNKPFEIERSALYVEIPENEALGRCFMDGQKTMAAAAHLGRKKRYSFECAAEFGHSYGQSYEDLFWWVKRSLMSGMNAQVLHGASYSGKYTGTLASGEQIAGTQWPGYEGFGKLVSNYWNRTLSLEDARGCIDTMTRLNTIFRKQAKIDCAIFRSSYSNDGAGSEHALYPDDGILSNRGYSYEFVSDFLLHLPACKVTNGLLDEEGVAYQCLIIPPQKRVSVSFLQKVKELAMAGLPVVWVGEKPQYSLFYSEIRTKETEHFFWNILDCVWSMTKIVHVKALAEVPDKLTQIGVKARIMLDGDMDIATAVRTEAEKKYYAVYGYNRVEYTPTTPNPDELAVSALYRKGTTKGTYERPGSSSRRSVALKLQGTGAVYRCNPWTGSQELEDFSMDEQGYMAGTVVLEEDELAIFVLKEKEVPVRKKKSLGELEYPVSFSMLELEAFEPERADEVSFLRSHFVKTNYILHLEQLLPWTELSVELKNFAGRGTYTGIVDIEQKQQGRSYMLCLGNVSDTFRVFVNGEESEFPDQVMNTVDVTELLKDGRNEIKVVVTSNLYNRLFHENMTAFGMPVPYCPRKYGIWESEGKKIALIER